MLSEAFCRISFWNKQYAKWTAPAEPSVPTKTTGVKAAEKELLAETKQVNAAVEAALEDTAEDSPVCLQHFSICMRSQGDGVPRRHSLLCRSTETAA